MDKKDAHLSDEVLLLGADGELSRRRAAQARAHLASCWVCRTRMAEIENAIRDFVRASHQEFDPELPPTDRSRARLKARLSELNRSSRSNAWRYLQLLVNGRSLAYAVAVLMLIAFGARFTQRRGEITEQVLNRSEVGADSLPNPNLTPGFVRPVTLVQLCSAVHDEVERPVSSTLQRQVFREYGMEGAAPADYEIDYLISPGLGGSDDIRNLWPEPRYDTEWNSYVKDQLEDQLHAMVCGGKLSLAAAQRDIAQNWIAAYKKYFHTDQAMPNYSSSYPIAESASVYLERDLSNPPSAWLPRAFP